MNKVLNIPLSGGLIGLLSSSPHGALRHAIQRENADGWRVVQVIPAASGSILYHVLRLVVLLCTLLLYTFDAGYYIVLEKSAGLSSGGTSATAPCCGKCGNNVHPEDAFCEYCGNKLA